MRNLRIQAGKTASKMCGGVVRSKVGGPCAVTVYLALAAVGAVAVIT